MSIDLIAQLRDLESEGERAIASAASADELEQLRVELLGRKGRLTGILRRLGELSAEERPRIGAEANRVKEALSQRLDERRAAAEEAPARDPGWVLVTVDGFPLGWGKRVGSTVKNHYPKGLRRRG